MRIFFLTSMERILIPNYSLYLDSNDMNSFKMEKKVIAINIIVIKTHT